MRKFLLNKLVRDKVYDNMVELGQQVESKTLGDSDFLRETVRKVTEETAEFNAKKPDAKELADIIEAAEAVIQAAKKLAPKAGVTADQLGDLQAKRRADRGGFDKRIYVKSLTLKDDDPWADYYAKETARFKEVKISE